MDSCLSSTSSGTNVNPSKKPYEAEHSVFPLNAVEHSPGVMRAHGIVPKVLSGDVPDDRYERHARKTSDDLAKYGNGIE